MWTAQCYPSKTSGFPPSGPPTLRQATASSMNKSRETQPVETVNLVQASSTNVEKGSGSLTFRQSLWEIGEDNVRDDTVAEDDRVEPEERNVITQASNKVYLIEQDAGALTFRQSERSGEVDDARDDAVSEVNKEEPKDRCVTSQASNNENLFEQDSGPLTFRQAEMTNHFLGFCRLTTSSLHILDRVQATSGEEDVTVAAAMTAKKGYVRNYSEIEAGYFTDGFQYPKGDVPHEGQGGRRDLRLGVRLQGEQGLGG